ncbi:hypothetical protein Tco_1160135, partial [Tanacetum coccineum]
ADIEGHELGELCTLDTMLSKDKLSLCNLIENKFYENLVIVLKFPDATTTRKCLKKKDLKPPRSITEARSFLYRDTNNAACAFTSLTGICVGITFQTFIRPLEMGTCIRADN